MRTPARTEVDAQNRLKKTISVKSKSGYIRPQYSHSTRLEKATMFPRLEDRVVFLKSLGSFTQERETIENEQANPSLDPRKSEMGDYGLVDSTLPFYVMPTGLDYADLPVEHPQWEMLMRGVNRRKSDNSTLTVSTVIDNKTVTVSGDHTADYPLFHACYVGDDTQNLRHIVEIDYNVTTVGETTFVFNEPFNTMPVVGDTLEAGPVSYYFDDTQDIWQRFTLHSRTDTIVEKVMGGYYKSFSMNADRSGFLKAEFSMGALAVYKGSNTNFMRIAQPISSADYSNIQAVFSGGTLSVDNAGGYAIGDSTLTVDDGGGIALTTALPEGMVIEIDGEQYHTAAGSTTTSIVLAETLVATVADDATITVFDTGNFRYTTAEKDGVINVTSNASVGAMTISVEDSANSALATAPAAGVWVDIDGEMYVTDEGCTTSALKLASPLVANVALGASVKFATKSKIGVYDATLIDPMIVFTNGDTDEIMTCDDSGGVVEKSPGVEGYLNWDVDGSPNTISNVWRGLGGTTLKPILDYDNLNVYAPNDTTAPDAAGKTIKAAKDMVTYFGGTRVPNRSVSITANTNTEVDNSMRSLDDYSAGNIEIGDRTYEFSIDTDFLPEMFRQRYGAFFGKSTSLQTTIGALKGYRVSVFIPKITPAEPSASDGDKKQTTTLSGSVYQDQPGVPAFVVAFA